MKHLPELIHNAAHTEAGEVFVYCTKRIRIPRAAILDIRPARGGSGTIIVTARGVSRVCEDFASLVRHLYGVNITQGERSMAARQDATDACPETPGPIGSQAKTETGEGDAPGIGAGMATDRGHAEGRDQRP